MRFVNFDTETDKILPGLLAPRMVCLSWTERVGSELARNLLTPTAGIDWFHDIINDAGTVVCGQNIPYDLAVVVSEAEHVRGADYAHRLLVLVFDAIADGRVSDVKMRESLLLLARGWLSSHPLENNRRPGVSLQDTARRRLGIDLSADKKNPDAWRLRYGELRGIPLEVWPEDATRYAIDDPRIQHLCWEDQLRDARELEYTDADRPWLVVDEARKIACDWALHLTSCWGMRTDPEAVSRTTARIELAGSAVEKLLLASGLGEAKLRAGKPYVSQVRSRVQDRVARVFAGLQVSHEELQLYLDAAEPEDDTAPTTDTADDAGDLTAEQSRILDAIIASDGRAVDIPDVTHIPAHLEPYPLVRFSWGAPKTPEQQELAKQHEGRICLDPTGQEWTWPSGKLGIKLAQSCAGQVITKITGGGGGVAYRDRTTGALVTPVTAPSKTFPQGQVAYSREVLEASNDPLLLLLAALGRVVKLRTTYVPQLIHGLEHPIQPRYYLPKETGRTSSSGPNIQNVPTFGGIRECFVAREGWALLDADIDRAECVAWATWCEETFEITSSMGEVLRSGKDLHTWTAIHFPAAGGISYDEAAAKIKAGDPTLKELRKVGKSGVFAWMGGAGPDTICKISKASGFEMSRAQAVELIAVLNRAYPEGRLAAAWVSEQCPGDSTFTFTQRVSGRRRGGCGYTDGRNQPFQGGIADLTGDILFHVSRECYADTHSPLYGARVWAYIHDEFILECPYDAWGPARATAAAQRLEQIIKDRGAYWFPNVPTNSEAAYARRWVKDRRTGREIKAVRNADGHLIPMEDAESVK